MINKINETIKEKLGENAKIIKQIDTINNKVFVIKYNRKEYIFKIYHSLKWPEIGKPPYINEILNKYNIKHPSIIAYDREWGIEGGYIIEEKFNGISALDSTITFSDLKIIYPKMAKFIKKVHKIKYDNYAYLDNGNPSYDKIEYENYLSEMIEESLEVIEEKGLFKTDDIYQFSDVVAYLIASKSKEPVLCHGDLSIRNVLYENNKISLIDWDDAMALPAWADISRMTYDMKFNHSNNEYIELRKLFLDEYLEENEYQEFNKFEELYHIFSSVEFIAFSLKRNPNDPKLNDKVEYLKELYNKYNKTIKEAK